jgi:hypothetical protein
MATVDDPEFDERSIEARILLKDRYRTRLVVPIQYLKPLQPVGVGDKVMVIAGDSIGMEGVVKAIEDSQDKADRQWRLASTKDNKKIMCSATVDQLCCIDN